MLVESGAKVKVVTTEASQQRQRPDGLTPPANAGRLASEPAALATGSVTDIVQAVASVALAAGVDDNLAASTSPSTSAV